jgi:hypothetical protein
VFGVVVTGVFVAPPVTWFGSSCLCAVVKEDASTTTVGASGGTRAVHRLGETTGDDIETDYEFVFLSGRGGAFKKKLIKPNETKSKLN